MRTDFDPLAQRYPSQRFPLYARSGMVSCSSPQAAAAGLERALARRGHRVSVDLDTGSFGRGQMIVRLPNGVLVGGTESRTDSNIALF